MAEALKTPGVYIVEKSSNKRSVVQVSTAVPVFISYTEKAEVDGRSFHMKPVQISSLSEYETFFGGAPKPVFSLKESNESSSNSVSINGRNYTLNQSDNSGFMLHSSLKLFFDNGGADCYILSIGQYGTNSTNLDLSADAFKKGIDKMAEEEVPTMILMPDSLLLEEESGDYYAVQTYALMHCEKYMNKISLFDIWGGNRELEAGEDKKKYVKKFRESIGLEGLTYGAAYFPWVHTNIYSMNNIGYNFFDLDSLDKILLDNHKIILNNLKTAETIKEKNYWDSGLKSASREYKMLRKIVCDKLNLLPASPALAGLYTRTDRAKGVWIAPANQNLNSVLAPSVNITHDEQENLNVDALSGKSINAIRAFKGRGSAMVWGARTLAGNSQEWRYINVRRLFILIEQSIKNAANAVVFKPNVPLTWAIVISSINSFLAGLWRQGALVGSSPENAYEVQCGLGSTMSEDDVHEGIMRIQVKVAPSRPAEFVVITFEQKLGGEQ